MEWEKFCQNNPPPENLMKVDQLIEARDSRARSKALLLTSHSRQSALNTPRVSLPAEFTLGKVVAVQGPRICVHMLGTDDMHDQWFLCDSDDIRPVDSVPDKPHLQLHPPQAFRGDPAHYNRFVARAKEKYAPVPLEAFKGPPKAPPSNLFQIGDKIEAVDLSYPSFICPATVRELSGNYLRVGFDGWREGFDYWTRYDSRDIFPAGWCGLVGHELQSPGAHEQSCGGRRRRPTEEAPTSRSKREPKTATVPDETASNYGSSISPGAGRTSEGSERKRKSHSPGSKSTKSVTQKKKYNGGRPRPSTVNVRPSEKKKVLVQHIQDSQDEDYPPTSSSPLPIPQPVVVLGQMKQSPSTPPPEPDHREAEPHHPGSSSPRPSSPSWSNKDDGGSISNASSYSHNALLRPLGRLVPESRMQPSLFVLKDGRCLPNDPVLWSVDDVFRYFADRDCSLSGVAHILKDADVDGLALMLISMPTITKHLNIKLGPAVKLKRVIDELMKHASEVLPDLV